MEEDYQRCMQMSGAALSLNASLKDVQDPITSLFAYLGAGVAGVGLQEYYRARRCLQSALTQATLLRSPGFVTLCLPVAAILVAHEVEIERAVELIGLAFTHPSGAPSWMRKWPPLEQLLVDLRAELGTELFETVWARGAALELETVVAGVKKDLDDDFGRGNSSTWRKAALESQRGK